MDFDSAGELEADLLELKRQAELYQPGLGAALIINVDPNPQLASFCDKNNIKLLINRF